MTAGPTVAFLLAFSILSAAGAAVAQPLATSPRIGFLTTGSSAGRDSSPNVAAFRKGLAEFDHVEGRNVTIEYRWAEGRNERLPGLAADLVRLNVAVIVATGTPAVSAAQQATKTIPIVMLGGGGFVTNLARPEGNITGVTNIPAELSGKRLELLREALPRVSRVAILWDATIGNRGSVTTTEEAARSLAVPVEVLEVRRRDDLKRAFEAALTARAGALVVLSSGMFHANRTLLAELAARHRIPAMFEHRDYVEAGGLMAYGPNFADMFRRGAAYVVKILRGARPADLPVERPTRFELILNMRAAKSLGLTIPPSLLLRADQVIE